MRDLITELLKKYLGIINKPGVCYSNSYVELYFEKVKFDRDSIRLKLGFGLLKIGRFVL